MDFVAPLAQGFAVALQPHNLGLAFVGCFLGMIIGALPGLGPVNGVAILIPLAFTLGLDPTSALILLTCVYYGTMYGGSISSIMLNIPGEAAAMMTALDGYPMAQAGKGAQAMAISAVGSFVGAMLATVGLMLFSPLLVRAAIHFGPIEYFALYVLAFATIGGVAESNPIKTLLAAFIGLALATVGLDAVSAVPRYTFGSFYLFDGINPIVAIVGLFAISEMLAFLEQAGSGTTAPAVKITRAYASPRELLFAFGAMLRGSVVGFFAGVMPGSGATLGSLLSYTLEKRVSNRDDTFGKGDPRGVAAPEAGNNAAAGGALVPMLSLGLPGSGTTAVMLALLISLNIQPGPLLFEKQPDLVWGLIAALFIANVILLIMNMPMVGLFTWMMSMPMWALMPFVVLMSFVGVYSINQSAFDLYAMVAFGLFGFVLRKLDVSLIPIVLGLLLGTEMENNFRRALSISGGDYAILFSSPVGNAIYALTAVMLAIAFYLASKRSRRTA